MASYCVNETWEKAKPTDGVKLSGALKGGTGHKFWKSHLGAEGAGCFQSLRQKDRANENLSFDSRPVFR